MAINQQSFLSILSQFSESFYSDDFQKLFSLEKTISEFILSCPSAIPLLESSIEYQKFKEDSSFYENSLTHLKSPDWELVSDINEIKVETKYSGADFYTRTSVLITSSIFETSSVLAEVDLLPSWYNICRIHALSQVTVLSSPSKFKKLMKFNFWFPWPLTNRECLLEFSAYPVPEDQAILILMRSPGSKYLNTVLPETNNQIIRMIVPIGCISIQYVSPKLTKVSILVQANATVIQKDLLPDWLLNFGKKQMMYFLMDSLRHSVLNFYGSEYENRIQVNSDLYDLIKKVLSIDVNIF
jgi:hypothetical protein